MIRNTISRYPKGFSGGVSIRGVPILNMFANNVFWVGSMTGVNASDANPGTYQQPLSSIEEAVSRCTASNGDIILVNPGYTETITAESDTAGMDLDVAGISVIGLGQGELRPTITFTTDADADIKIAAANITLANFIFKCNIASQAMMLELAGDGAWVENCSFREGTATGLNFITVGVADNDADRAIITGCDCYMPTAGNGDSAISFAKDHVGVRIINSHIYGDFDNAAIEIPAGGNAQVDCVIGWNNITNLQTGIHAIEINGTGSTGVIVGNKCVTDTGTSVIDSGGLACFDNEWRTTGDSDFEGTPALPVADTSTNFIGVDDSNNAAATTNVAANEDGSVLERLEQLQEAVNKGTGTAVAANKSLSDAIGFDGNAAVTATAGMLRTAAGSEIVITKTLTSSTVVQAGVDVTGVSTTGGLYLKDWSLRTNGTGLAAGTNFTLETDNAQGAEVFCTHAVASLGATVLIDKKTATLGKSTYLETGKKIIAKCTVADCTGAGTIAVDLVFVRAADNASIAAA